MNLDPSNIIDENFKQLVVKLKSIMKEKPLLKWDRDKKHWIITIPESYCGVKIVVVYAWDKAKKYHFSIPSENFTYSCSTVGNVIVRTFLTKCVKMDARDEFIEEIKRFHRERGYYKFEDLKRGFVEESKISLNKMEMDLLNIEIMSDDHIKIELKDYGFFD